MRKQLSAAKYGKPRAVVEKEIFERLATKTPEPKPFANPFAGSGVPQGGNSVGAPIAPAPVMGPPSAGSGSFLDEWLAKQKSMPATPRPAVTSQLNAPVETQSQPQAAANPVTDGPVMPVASQNTDITTPQGSYESGNVSSAEIDQQEVKDIAAELKKGLKTTEGNLDVQAPPKSLEVSNSPQPKSQSEVVRPGEDTIVIDSDGTIHMKNPSEDE